MPQAVRAAVFPVAGRGTRFLPATKANAKEMLPIVDKPLIQYAVDEAVAAGATKLVFVTARSKGVIADHFSPDAELEQVLSDSGKSDLLESVRDVLPDGVTCAYVIQEEPLGLGHAVLCAKDAVGDEPFFVHLCDDLIASEPPCLRQLVDAYDTHGKSIVAVEEVPDDKTSSYGIIAVEQAEHGQRLTEIVEKPQPQDAPSNLAVVGRYLLVPEIFEKLERIGRGAGGEIQLTDAIADLLDDMDVYAYPFSGIRYDCGSKLGYLEATVAYGKVHPEIGPAFGEYLKRNS